MRTLPLLLLVCAGAACNVIIAKNGSNLSDGGECPAIDGGGSASLTGVLAFPVTSALESDLEIIPLVLDGGQPVRVDGGFEEGDGGPPLIWLWLLGPANACAAGGLCFSPLVSASFVKPADAGSGWNGSYAIGDGGAAGFELQAAYGDGGLTTYDAVSGQIQVTSTAACSLAGSFAVVLGTDAGSPLSGTFQAVYSP
jgi:hypothetical protein